MELSSIQPSVLQVFLVVTATLASPNGWIPIPTIKPTPTAASTTTASPPALTPPEIFQYATTDLVNSLRYSYQVQPVTWNSTLESAARTCAERQALTDDYATIMPCDCGGTGAAATVGFSDMAYPSQGARDIISTRVWPAGTTDRSQQLAWYASFSDTDGATPPTPCIDFNANPIMPNATCSYFTQLIWKATTQFGCAYSLGATPTLQLRVLSCCWNPAGNDAATFAANVFAGNA